MIKGVSIIVCCYNSASRLPETLRHIIQQKTDGTFGWELVVVDNASTDNTFELANQILANSALKYQVVKEYTAGLIHARLKGQSVSQYEFLLYCDDDNWLAENYVQLVYDTMIQSPKMAILGGRAEAVFETQEPVWFKKYQHNFAVGDQSSAKEDLSQVQEVYGAGFTVRRSFLQLLREKSVYSLLTGRKGNQLISGEDTELCYQAKHLGYEVWYHRGLKFKHLMTASRMNWNYMKRLYYGFGRTIVYTLAYKHMEQYKEIPGEHLKIPLWLDKFIYKLKLATQFYPKVMFKMNDEGNDDVLKYMAMKGELSELWNLKEEYSEVFRKIQPLLNPPLKGRT